MSMPWSELLSGVELLILVFLTIRAIGERGQAHKDVWVALLLRLDGHDRQLSQLDDRVQALRELRLADRLSRLESSLPNLEARLRADLVSKDTYDGWAR